MIKYAGFKRPRWGLSLLAGFAFWLLAANPSPAYQGMPLPKLHVAGRYLMDPDGKRVNLHGYMQPAASWFNGEGRNFIDPRDFTAPVSVAPALAFLNGVSDLMTHTGPALGQDHGWYCSFVRFIGDDGGVSNFAPGWDAAGNLANPAQFNGWIENMLVPYLEHCRADGLYVVICGNPSVAYPGNDATKNMTRQYQQNLVTFWTAIASHPAIKGAANVMFEICNEPIQIESKFGANDWASGNDVRWAALTSFMQPIVDAIRAVGADNVVWIPGLGWQGEYQGFPAHPVAGDNVGYAAHLYPAYGNAHDNVAAVNRLWATNYKPTADKFPLLVTELMWTPNNGVGYQDLWNATTSGFGLAVKSCFDDSGNVSYLIGMTGDVVGNINSGLSRATLPTVDGASAAFSWWTTYLADLPTGAIPTPAEPSILANISTRSRVGVGFDVQIAGFVITGSAPKRILVRAAGPALTGVGVPGSLADPVIELHDNRAGVTLATNDNWASALAPTFSAVGAFSWTAGSKDAALVTSLAPGLYSVVVKGQSDGTGVALVEVYDVDKETASRTMNISTRSYVGTDNDVQIAGFVIAGAAPKRVLIRAAGPALQAISGADGCLADPILELHAQDTTVVLATNDNWNESLSAAFSRVGAFSWTVGSKDAALETTLIPGAYTVIVRGSNGGKGTALVEVYDAD
jgi:hypothetical protein